MHREVQLVQGTQQRLDGVGQDDGAGGVGQKACPRDQGRHPDAHDDGIPDALGVDGEKAPAEQGLALAADKKHVQHGCEQDDGQDRLEAAPDHLEGDPGHAVHRPQEQDRQGQPQRVGRSEQHRDIGDGQDQLEPRVKAVDQAVPREVLADGDVTDHTPAPPSFSPAGRGRVRLSPASRRALASTIFFTA